MSVTSDNDKKNSFMNSFVNGAFYGTIGAAVISMPMWMGNAVDAVININQHFSDKSEIQANSGGDITEVVQEGEVTVTMPSDNGNSTIFTYPSLDR